VSAPPDILDSLLSDTPLSRFTCFKLTIPAPYHAEHLYTDDDVDALVSSLGSFPLQCESAKSSVPIISTTTAETLPAVSFPEALRTVVKDALRHMIRWDLTAGSLATHIRQSEANGKFTINYIAAASDSLGSLIQKSLGTSAKFEVNPRIGSHLNSTSHGAPTAKSKIAVIGASGRFPNAPSMDAFWDVLSRGVDTHELVPPSRWSASTHVGDSSTTSMAKNVSGTGFGCWLHNAADFDARFFNMSPREAPQVDPAQRIALLTAAEALEQAGIVPGRTQSTQKDRVGVYFGSTSNDWMETNSAQGK
jgi:hypothetical protein